MLRLPGWTGLAIHFPSLKAVKGRSASAAYAAAGSERVPAETLS
jgi:hypothetical protein